MFVRSYSPSLLRTAQASALVVLLSAPALAQEHAAASTEPVNLLAPNAGLMFWTLVVFVLLFVILVPFGFKPLFASVEERERALEEAIEGAKRDREAASALLTQQQSALEAARTDAQRIIAESRSVAEKMRTDMLAQTRAQQEDLLEQARRTIEGEKVSAIAELRRESIDLAIAGASRVIEQNLDTSNNRRIVEQFLGSLDGAKVNRT